MKPTDWLTTLNADQLDHLEAIIYQERYKRNRSAALSDEAVQQEVDRVLRVRDARRKEAADQWEEHKVKCLKRRIRQFEEGRLGMCSCRDCLTGYVSLDISRMCKKGQWQFWLDAERWKPWTP
jgi:hypothetical protein